MLNAGDKVIYKGRKVEYRHSFNSSVWVKMPNGDKIRVPKKDIKRIEDF